MGLDLLDTPLRLNWDVPADKHGHTAAFVSAVAGQISAGGVFVVTLQNRPLLHPAIDEIVDILEGTQLLIACRGETGELASIRSLPQAACQLLLDVGSFTDAVRGVDVSRLDDVVAELRQCGHEPTLVLTPLRSNLSNIPGILRFCAGSGIAKFKLSNAHIGDSFHDYSPDELPRWQDLADFREVWGEFSKEAHRLPSLEIHDLFLWEIMTPGDQQNRSEYGGCQAGNSLGHIDVDGVVHPCAAWPQPLGRLPEESLSDIWAGRQRLAVRERIATTPDGCIGCSDLDVCYGGCRGLARYLNRSAGERDLMCRGRR